MEAMHLNGLNLLINNSAIMDESPASGLHKAERDLYNRHFDVNVTSQVMVIKVRLLKQFGRF